MATGARLAQGTLLKIGDAGSPTEAFTTIAEVKNIVGPQLVGQAIEATNHDSPNAYREYIAGLNNGGLVTFSVNWKPADATQNFSAGILRDFDARNLRNFKIVFPAAAPLTWAFAAFCIKFAPQAPVDGILEVQLELQISGRPTLA